jgi:hypothetical protein
MKSEVLIEIIKIMPSFIWPITTIIIICIFKNDIENLFSRIKSGTLFGNDFVLEEKVDKLEKSVESENIVVARKDEVLESQAYKNENAIGKLVILSGIIEKELKQIMYKSGWFNNVRIGSIKNTINFLVSNNTLPPNILSSVDLFMDIRNKVVHGTESVNNDQIERILEVGLIIINQIRSIPLSDHIIENPKIEIFYDKECKQKNHDAFGVMIKEVNSITKSTRIDIYPTTNIYSKGVSVSWEWNLNVVFRCAYFIHPETKEVLKAWDQSALFIGRNIEEI